MTTLKNTECSPLHRQSSSNGGEGMLLEVRTGCRLHFGLLELAQNQDSRFGGLGLMLDQPSWHLRFTKIGSSADHKQHSTATQAVYVDQPPVDAHIRDEVLKKIQQAQEHACDGKPPQSQVQTIGRLALHSGLGAGTQLACAVAVGEQLASLWHGDDPVPWSDPSIHAESLKSSECDWTNIHAVFPSLSLEKLTALSGRGLRSAIGLVGFLNGGLVFDRGYDGHTAKDASQTRSINAATVHLPADWRVVLLVPETNSVVSGEQEARLLHEVGRHPNPHRSEMIQLAATALEIINTSGDFTSLMNVLENYMFLAASLFAPHQGGLYNGVHVAEAVELAKRCGLRGVGQSSWGPTVFGFALDDVAAQTAVQELNNGGFHGSIAVAKPARHGAQWRRLASHPMQRLP